MQEQSFGNWLKRKRKSLDLTQEQLAKQVGCSAAAIRKIEAEERRPSAQTAERMAEIFDIPPAERKAFLRFARGDWRSAPTQAVENIPWLAPDVRQAETAGVVNDLSNLKTHLATFFFTDIENSTELWEAAPEQMKIALKRHHTILQEAIQSNGGTVFQIIGDAFCASFPTVLAAISTAVTAQQQLYRELWDLPFPIRVRMGIHTGEAERTSNNEYASNPTLNRVARILSAAHGGQVVLSLATKDLVKDSLPANTEIRDMGEHYLRNLSHPEHLFQLNIAGLPSDFPPLNTLTHRYTLPVQVTSFIAREAEIALIHKYLLQNDIHLVTLIGPPGIGKTRLSIEAARASLQDFSDGVFFVALAPLEDPNLIPSTIAQALGYVGTKNISTIEQLKEGIGDKNLLLVLDNCEHLIEAVAFLTTDLLSTCSHLRILATSRESLRIPGEWLYAVPAFDLPTERSSLDVETASKYPALTLFAERARAVRADFTLNADNIETIAAICAYLDGLPLAIELIAARIRLMSPQALLDRLSGQFVLTADGMRAASERQKTLHSAIDLSYKLLAGEEQKLFAYLSVFSGGFMLRAVESMFSRKVTGTPLSNLIALLLDKSLLKLAPDLEASGEVRYTMLMTIQEFARERLKEMGEEIEIRNVHLAYFFKLAKKADKEVRGPNQAAWLRHLSTDRDNLRSSLSWAVETRQTEVALQMVGYLSLFWFRRSNLSEGRQWLGQVLILPDAPQYPSLYSYSLTQLAFHAWLQSGPKEAGPLVEQAISVARAHSDEWNTAWALTVKGLILISERNFEVAQSTLETSKTLFREIHDEWGYANAVIALGNGAYNQDDQATALSLHEESLSIFRKLGDRYFESVALRFIGMLGVKQGNLSHGVASLREALILAQQLDSKYEIAAGIRHIGNVAQTEGNFTKAVSLYWASRNIFDSIGAWQQEGDAEFENDLAPCRSALSESAFAEALKQGRAMTMEQAIDYALESSKNL